MKMNKLITLMFAGGIMAVTSHAAVILYDGGVLGDQVQLNVAANWAGDVEPAAGSDIGRIENFDSTSATVRLGDLRDGRHYQFAGTTFWDIGTINSRTKTSHLEFLDTAVFKVGKEVQVEGGGSITVNSSVNTHTAIDAARFVNFNGSNGQVDHLSGIVDARQGLQMITGSGNIYSLSGGTLLLTDLTVGTRKFAFASDNYLDFTTGSTGELSWGFDEDMTATFTDRITNGFVRINGQVSTVADFDIVYTAGSGTTMTAIPEPATLGMIAMFGGGILFIRRRFMI